MHSSIGIAAIVSAEERIPVHTAVACIPLVTEFETSPSLEEICKWIQSCRPRCRVVQFVPLLAGGMGPAATEAVCRICKSYSFYGIITKVAFNEKIMLC